MKTPQEYADELVDKYYKLLSNSVFHSLDRAMQCAIIDVNNTIEALENVADETVVDVAVNKMIAYHKQVLTILESKL